LPHTHFDLIAHLYDRIFRFHGPEQLLKLLQPQSSDRILDLGGGTGRVSATFGSNHMIVVCDSSWGMLKEAQQKGLAACCGVAERLPFANNSFERILVIDAFHHFSHQETAASEALRVLSPAGRLVIEEPDIRCPWVKFIALAERLLLMRSRFLSLGTLTQLLETAGAQALASQENNCTVWLVATVGER